MDFALVSSKKDPASTNIANTLINEFSFRETREECFGNKVFSNGEKKLFFLNDLHVTADYVEELPFSQIVFLSQHKSEKNIPCLTVHALGNYSSSAEVGGKPKTLSGCSAFLNKALLIALNSSAKKHSIPWQVCLETTHHGPFLEKPSAFIEVGSTQKEWLDANAARAVCEAVLNAEENPSWIPAIGIGDMHYCQAFTKIQLNSNTALGHIIPKYAIDEVDFALFKQALEKTLEQPKLALIEWKSLNSEQRKKFSGFCSELGVEWKKAKSV